MRHRPIGIGIQGLTDAQQLNKDIFETIYYHSLKASCELAVKEDPYETYEDNPMSKPDMWGITPSDRWDWGLLKEMIAEHGVRNSLLVAPMPTASNKPDLGNNECFEPYTSNQFKMDVESQPIEDLESNLVDDPFCFIHCNAYFLSMWNKIILSE